MPHQDKIEEAGGTPWSRGGEYVYGDDELSEGLYALEDEAIVLPAVDGKYIPYERMQDVMVLYRERLKKHVKEMKDASYQQGVEDGREFMGEVSEEDLDNLRKEGMPSLAKVIKTLRDLRIKSLEKKP